MSSVHDMRPLAVAKAAWQRGWREVAETYQAATEDVRYYGTRPIDRLVYFERDLASSGLASPASAFGLAEPDDVATGQRSRPAKRATPTTKQGAPQ